MKNIVLFVFTTIPLLVFAQSLEVIKAPEDYQLYARDEKDSAEVNFAGKVSKGSLINALRLKVFKDGTLYDEQKTPLTKETFNLTTKIHAGLHQFRFELFVQEGTRENLFLQVNDVVCGDAYIITGQSNSHPSSTRSSYSNTFCRSFGVKTGYESYTEADKQVRWGNASGNCPGLEKEVGGWFIKNPFGVGVWGLELSRLLVEKYKVPVCIINGGSGSSSIEQNMLYPEKPSLETSFGRLAFRVDQARLKDKIKAIFWHQGETNTNTVDGYSNYARNFERLLADWKRVYKGLKKVYLFQLHPGCGRNRQGFYNELRQIQNQLSEDHEMVDIMSTMGVKGHDGCHFSYEGYLEFAHRIFPLVARDFYGENNDNIIVPPKLLGAKHTGKNAISLYFDQAIALESSRKVEGKVRYLKDQFFFKEDKNEDFVPSIVKNLEADGNTVTLFFDHPVSHKFITYLPSKFYQGTKTTYNGPWLTGKTNGIGALSFHARPIWKLSKTDPFVKKGYKVLDSTFNGVNFKLVVPKNTIPKRHWVWRARFWGHEPQTDLALLEKGFHVAYVDVAGMFGNERAIKIWDDFYAFMVGSYGLNEKVALEGMSRGGLIVLNWANRNSEKIASIYVDAPVGDFKSWPAGKGAGKGSVKDWKICLQQYGFSETLALKYMGNPVDHLENLASKKIPILAVVGDADQIVPVSENTGLLEKRLKELEWQMTIINKPGVGHHPHSLVDPKPIVDFIKKYAH